MTGEKRERTGEKKGEERKNGTRKEAEEEDSDDVGLGNKNLEWKDDTLPLASTALSRPR